MQYLISYFILRSQEINMQSWITWEEEEGKRKEEVKEEKEETWIR